MIERLSLRPLRGVKGPSAMITTIGVSYILFNLVLLFLGADSKNYPNPLPPLTLAIGGAVLRLREVLIWVISLVLMGALDLHPAQQAWARRCAPPRRTRRPRA